jgi:hypothetical protein
MSAERNNKIAEPDTKRGAQAPPRQPKPPPQPAVQKPAPTPPKKGN